MHFPIICIEKLETPKEEWVANLPYDDRTLNEYTDYYGEMYTKEERLEVIRSKWLKDLFDGFATIDARKGTITFLDYDTVTRRFKDYLINLTKDLYEKAIVHKLYSYQLHFAGGQFRNTDVLFFQVYGQTSFDFIDDAKYMAGQTYCIGNIFDAHI